MGVDDRTALIVGAGIGGLAAGVALQRAGWRVRIFERAATPRELGFALLLAPNALASLRSIGLADTVIADGAIPARGEIRGRGGRLLRSFDMTAARTLLPEPIVVVLRPVLHGALLEAVGRDAVALDSPVVGFDIGDRRPFVQLAGGDTVAGDVLIGADGVGSIVRRVLHPHEGPPRRSGLWAVRGVAYGPQPDGADLAGRQYFGKGTEAGVSPASADASYWYVSVPDDAVGSERDPLAIAHRCARAFDDRMRAIVSATRPDDARLDEAPGSRSDRAVGTRTGHAPRGRRAPDAATRGAGSGAGARRRRRAGGRPRAAKRRPPQPCDGYRRLVEALRSGLEVRARK